MHTHTLLYSRGAQPVDRELPVDRQGFDSRSRDDCRGKVYIVKYTTNTGLRRIGRPPMAGKCKSRSHVKKGWAPLLYSKVCVCVVGFVDLSGIVKVKRTVGSFNPNGLVCRS